MTFSSALWPFSSLGWPNQTPDLATFFPTSVLVTGFDIIFFWVARMIMMSLKFTDRIPFETVYITGLIRDAEGHKMSKSKGNVLDPIDLIDGITLDALVKKRTHGLMQPGMAEKIEKTTRKEFPEGIPSYGTDALRFTFCSLASYTREIRFDTNRLTGFRNFCNKLWNASRYVLMNTEKEGLGNPTERVTLSLPDRWIKSRLQKTINDAHHALAQYRFDLYAQTLYDFTWNEYCDWYLELSKPVLYHGGSNPSEILGAKQTLVEVLEIILRLLHPVMPFITEEIWQRVAPLNHHKHTASIMLAPYPEIEAQHIDEEAVVEIEWIKRIIMAIRTIRSEMTISPSKQLSILLRKGNPSDHDYVTRHSHLLKTLAKIESVKHLQADEAPPPSASAFVGELEIYLPMAGFINVEEEQIRLNKEITKLEKELMGIKNKLNNPQFISKAPQEVVAKEKKKCAEIETTLNKLKHQLAEVKKESL